MRTVEVHIRGRKTTFRHSLIAANPNQTTQTPPMSPNDAIKDVQERPDSMAIMSDDDDDGMRAHDGVVDDGVVDGDGDGDGVVDCGGDGVVDGTDRSDSIEADDIAAPEEGGVNGKGSAPIDACAVHGVSVAHDEAIAATQCRRATVDAATQVDEAVRNLHTREGGDGVGFGRCAVVDGDSVDEEVQMAQVHKKDGIGDDARQREGDGDDVATNTGSKRGAIAYKTDLHAQTKETRGGEQGDRARRGTFRLV